MSFGVEHSNSVFLANAKTILMSVRARFILSLVLILCIGVVGQLANAHDAEVADISGLSQANLDLREQLAIANALVEKQQAEIEMLHDQHLQSQMAAVRLVAQEAKVRRAAAATLVTIRNRTQRNAFRNAASVVAEGLPWVGVGVVLTVTALELEDACSTMRDLGEVQEMFGASLTASSSEVCGIELPTKSEIWDAIVASPHDIWGLLTTEFPELVADGANFEWIELGDWIPYLE